MFTSKSVPCKQARSVTFQHVEDSRPTDGSLENITNFYIYNTCVKPEFGQQDLSLFRTVQIVLQNLYFLLALSVFFVRGMLRLPTTAIVTF